MHTIRGQALPSSFLENPYDTPTLPAHKTRRSASSSAASSSSTPLHNVDSKGKRANKKGNSESMDLGRMISASIMTSTAILGPAMSASAAAGDSGSAAATPTTPTMLTTSVFHSRDRSGSIASQRSNRSSGSFAAAPLGHGRSSSIGGSDLPPLPLSQSSHLPVPQSKLAAFLKRRKPSASAAASSPDSLSSASLSAAHLPVHHHTILMASPHDIHITWPYPVPTGNVFIAGTFTVPGHGPWDRIPMTLNEDTGSFEALLNVQEVEDVSDCLDDADTPLDQANPTATTGTLSKRQRIRRFFGRARSSSASSTAPSDKVSVNGKESCQQAGHQHHQHHSSKDSTASLPFTKEYRYQYKFVVDDNWQCDPQRHQIQDDHGNWNHELVVELVEQQTSGPETNDSASSQATRSRSSSIQSHTEAVLVPSKPQEEQVQAQETTKGDQVAIVATTAAITADTTTTVTTTTTATTTTTTTEATEAAVITPPVPVENVRPMPLRRASTFKSKSKSAPKVKNTFEAVLIFDEHDDLSDGENVLRDSDEYDSDDYEEEEEEEEQEEEEHANQQVEAEANEIETKAENVTPQQHQQHGPQEEAQTQPQAQTTEQTIEQTTVQPPTTESTLPVHDESKTHQAEEEAPTPTTVEAVITETEAQVSDDHSGHTNVTHANVGVAAADIEADADIAKDTEKPEQQQQEIEQTDLAQPAEQTTVDDDETTTIHVETRSLPEVTPVTTNASQVEEAHKPEEENTVPEVVPKVVSSTRRLSYAEAVRSHIQETEPPKAFALMEAADPTERRSPRPSELVTDPTEAPSTPLYHQVPSPPLTPSSLTPSLKTELLGFNDTLSTVSSEAEEEEVVSRHLEASALLTPKSEAPTSKSTPVVEKEERAAFGTTTTTTTTTVRTTERKDSSGDFSAKISSSIERKNTVENQTRKQEEKEDSSKPKSKSTDPYPSLIWSICKTTVVVSAAVVVLGLGFGRRRD